MNPVRLRPGSSTFEIESVEERRRQLGLVDEDRVGPFSIGRSVLPEILGDRAVPVNVVQEPRARVLYFDFDLGALLGIPGAETGRMTEALEALLIKGLSYRIPVGDSPLDRPVITAYADRYGGVGLGKSRGAGRAVILPWGNLVAHGVGETPLVSIDPEKFPMHRGGAPMIQAWSRMIRGAVYDETFDVRGSRILAILDWGEYGVAPKDLDGVPEGARERRGVFIRAGLQLRPAHLLEGETEGGAFSAGVFERGTRAAGIQVPGDPVGTMRSAAERHARIQAQAMRYRILHGVLSTSNMQIDGGMLDVEASTAQPGTAPIMSMDFKAKFGFVSAMDQFGFEHLARAHELQVAYDAVRGTVEGMPELSVADLLIPRYEQLLAEELVVATGLMRGLARAVLDRRPEIGERLARTIVQLTRLIGPGNRNLLPVPRRISAVRIFSVLAELPSRFFVRERDRALPEIVYELLKLDPFDSPAQHAARLEARAWALARELAEVWRQLMETALEDAAAWYGSTEAMRASVEDRARFSNADLTGIERDHLEALVLEGVEDLERTGSAARLLVFARECVAGSLRSADRLLRQGEHVFEADGSLVTQRRRCAGVGYALRVREGAASLEVELPKEHEGAARIDLLAIAGSKVAPLRPRKTTDRRFEAEVASPRVARLIGSVRDADGDRLLELGGYAFALPEKAEREALVAALSGPNAGEPRPTGR